MRFQYACGFSNRTPAYQRSGTAHYHRKYPGQVKYNACQSEKDFDVSRPRIAVLGLNPHAGDRGLVGSEEETIIKPAIRQAKDKDMLVFGHIALMRFCQRLS